MRLLRCKAHQQGSCATFEKKETRLQSMMMLGNTVYNLTRQALLADNVRWATTFWQRAVGLLGKRELSVGRGLAIRPCKSVHMLGMRFAIDVIYVSKDKQVVACVSQLRPWRLGPMVPNAHWVLELPAGTIARTGTCRGDRLEVAVAIDDWHVAV
jgi:uncharacterized membrane protein (UPF0127 family)